MMVALVALAAAFAPTLGVARAGARPAMTRRHGLLRLNGGAAKPYVFQDVDERRCRVIMPIDDERRAKDVRYSLKRGVLTLGVDGEPTAIDEEALWSGVNNNDCWWEIDDVFLGTRAVVLELAKKESGKWRHLLKSDDVRAATCRRCPHRRLGPLRPSRRSALIRCRRTQR